MTQHTPGPWFVGEEVDSEWRLVYIPIRRGRLHSSTTGVYGKRPDGTTAGPSYTDRFGTERSKPIISADECRANARLIAAAPDMLAALERARAALEGIEEGYEPDTIEYQESHAAAQEVRKAIAAATSGA